MVSIETLLPLLKFQIFVASFETLPACPGVSRVE
jgi:hypothetical protein